MAFPKSLKTNYIVKSLAGAGKHSSTLTPFELAILDASNYTSLSPANVAGNEVILAVGSPNQGQAFAGLKVERLHDQLNTTHSFKSQPITAPKQILTQKFTKDDKVNVYYLGWNGLNNACKALEFECGKTYQFDLYVKGREVRNIFGQEMRDVIEFTTPCCDCTGVDCDTHLNCGLYVDQLVAQFNDPNRWLSRFFKAEAVVDCVGGDPITPPNAEIRNVYTLTLCDRGDELALADVQAQYPTSKVEVINRDNPYTTYQLVDVEEAGTPDPFTYTPTMAFDCECPSGWTEVPGGDLYSVKVDPSVYGDNFDTDAETTLGILLNYDFSAEGTSVTVLAQEADVLCFEVTILTGGLLDPIAIVNSGVTATLLGTSLGSCTQDSTSTEWVLSSTVEKYTRDLCVTVAIPDCPAVTDDAITALEAEFATFATNNDLTSPVTSTEGSCAVEFTVGQLSNEWIDPTSCDTDAWRTAKWDILPSFKGQTLKTCNCVGYTVDESTGCVTGPTADTDCCQCGIKFTAHDFRTTDDLLDAPVYDINEYLEKDAVQLSVSLLIPDGQTQVCSDTQPDFWQSQFANFRTLQGRDVLKEVIMEHMYRQEPYFNAVDKLALLLNKREGLRYGVDLNAYYYAITLSHNVANEMNWTGHNHSVREDIVLFIHEDDVTLYNQVLASLRQAFNVPVKSLNA